jgi:hypothetical protein
MKRRTSPSSIADTIKAAGIVLLHRKESRMPPGAHTSRISRRPIHQYLAISGLTKALIGCEFDARSGEFLHSISRFSRRPRELSLPGGSRIAKRRTPGMDAFCKLFASRNDASLARARNGVATYGDGQ